jgi:hypothetical protein
MLPPFSLQFVAVKFKCPNRSWQVEFLQLYKRTLQNLHLQLPICGSA